MAEKERRVSARSLENLKLGAETRRLGKTRQNFTILPETLDWLRQGGNASQRIDDLVAAAKAGNLKSNYTYNGKDETQYISKDVYDRIVEELEETRLRLEQSQFDAKDMTDQLRRCHSDGFKAADILKAALKLKGSAGIAIKREIEKALELIDDI